MDAAREVGDVTVSSSQHWSRRLM